MNTNKTILAAALTVLAALSLQAVDSKIKEGGSIVVASSTEPDHLDPFLATSADTRGILFNVYDGLVKPDANGDFVAALAADLPAISADFLTYTFTLRPGVKFQDGKAITAADVKYSLEAAVQAKLPGLAAIKAVEAVGSSRVKVSLKDPDNDFLPYLTVAIVPKDYKELNTKPIGAGPFSVESYKPQQSLVLRKNAYYWQKGIPRLDTVTFKFEADSNATLLDLQAGGVDFGAVTDNESAQQLKGGYEIQQSNSNAVQQLNLNQAFRPFADIRVRQAISYAVDPDEIIQTVNFGVGTRVGSPVIPGLKTYYDSSLTYAYKKDLDKAKKLLADAGFTSGLKFTITVPSNYKVHVDTAQVIVNQLKAVGIEADIKQVDWPTWISKVYLGKEYDATIISVDGANLSPKSFLARYVTGAEGNFFNYGNKEFDAVYAQASAEPSLKRRVELFKRAQAILSKDAANVYIQDIANLGALKKGLDGRTVYPLYVTDVSTIYFVK